VSSRPSTTGSSGHETDQGGRFVPLESAKYLLLTTFKPDGTPMAVPVRVVVDGDRAYFGAWDASGTSKRLRHTDWVQVVPCSALGMASFGPAVNATARLLAGEEARQAAGRLARKRRAWRDFPGSLARRVTRRQTVYYELRPDEAVAEPMAPPLVTARALRARTDPGRRRLPPLPLRQPGPS
jgi:PPOX class probable F420-dependent enzyme